MITNHVSATGNTASAGAGASAASSTDATASQDRFLKLLVAQLNNQDPMNPMDNAEMTTQMAQINTVTGINQLNNTMQSMAAQFTAMQVLQGTSMIGRTVLAEGNRLGPPVDQVSTAAFDLTGSAGNVQVQITTPGGTVVDTVKMGTLDAGRHYFSWDSSAYAGDVGALRFQVEAMNGAAPVAHTALSPSLVIATSATDGALTLELANGERLEHNKVQAVF